ncbi:hypothetical protein ACQ4PT_066808 [Festuca glaucescens]
MASVEELDYEFDVEDLEPHVYGKSSVEKLEDKFEVEGFKPFGYDEATWVGWAKEEMERQRRKKEEREKKEAENERRAKAHKEIRDTIVEYDPKVGHKDEMLVLNDPGRGLVLVDFIYLEILTVREEDMTVTPGDCLGDRRVIPLEPAAGAFPTPSETSEPSPQAAGASSTPPVSLEPSHLGKFWVLADEDSASSSEEEDATTVSAGAFKYLCRSPSQDAGRDLVESVSGLARRAKKRLERQRRQRSAAREFASSCKVRSMVSTSPSSADIASPVRPRFPVLEPSTFNIAADDVLGWTVVQRRRRSSDLPNQSCSDPKISENSKTVLLGPFASCDRIREGVPGRPSLRNVS